ncbi:HD domain-containing protein [Mesorhizobium sp. NBSH29]|uniref:HD domain-containing protein n=1 Tax=Mesorhizobium sp. NBSH29 TaxID=2654249 RepID=UPI00189692D1|nr:hypothetical protein [Mesorhizobium sp. NBSH29]
MPLVDDALKASLLVLYNAPDRHYHNAAHIESLLAIALRHRPALIDADLVETAIWFHDAIYDSARKDNEEKSAELAARYLSRRIVPERLHCIVRMIEATNTHQVPDLGPEDRRRDAAMFLDMDLAILGAPPQEFDIYEAAVRKEYAWVSEDDWRKGRAAFLTNFLARPSVYNTPLFCQIYEDQARKNLIRSLDSLT